MRGVSLTWRCGVAYLFRAGRPSAVRHRDTVSQGPQYYERAGIALLLFDALVSLFLDRYKLRSCSPWRRDALDVRASDRCRWCLFLVPQEYSNT